MSDTKIITPEAIASYPTLVEPRPGPNGGDAKYSIALIFPEGTDLKGLKAAAMAAAEDKWGAKAKDMIKQKKLNMPFRTDTEAKGYPDGAVFFNARTTRQPTVVSRVPDADGKPTVLDPSAVYAGAYVKASLTAFAYDVSGNKGVSFGLNNIQFVRDCAPEERLDGKRAAVDEFDADTDAVADLSDLEEPATAGVGAGDDDDPLADLGT